MIFPKYKWCLRAKRQKSKNIFHLAIAFSKRMWYNTCILCVTVQGFALQIALRRYIMGALEYVLGGILIAMALFLTVVVLMQTGKDKRLSGSIAGGSDTYFGKSKGRSWDKILARVTTVVAILFAILTVVTYVLIAKHYVG